jgi:hypothetical protein
MSGRVGFKHLSAKAAQFTGLVNGDQRQFIFGSDVCPNGSYECGGFP